MPVPKTHIGNDKTQKGKTQSYNIGKHYSEPFPTNLRKLLDDTGITQTTISKVLGKEPQTVSRYYNGYFFPPLEDLVKIANFFGVSTDYLLGNTANDSTNEEILKVCNYIGLEYSNAKKLHERKTFYKTINDTVTGKRETIDRQQEEMNKRCIDTINYLIEHIALNNFVIESLIQSDERSQKIKKAESALIEFIKEPNEENYHTLCKIGYTNSFNAQVDLEHLDTMLFKFNTLCTDTFRSKSDRSVCDQVYALYRSYFGFDELKEQEYSDFGITKEQLEASLQKYNFFYLKGGNCNAKEDE